MKRIKVMKKRINDDVTANHVIKCASFNVPVYYRDQWDRERIHHTIGVFDVIQQGVKT